MRGEQRGDPGAGDHSAVAGHDHAGQPELVPHNVHDGGETVVRALAEDDGKDALHAEESDQ